MLWTPDVIGISLFFGMIKNMSRILRYLYNITLRNRRLNSLSKILKPYIPENSYILDLGCGTGDLAAQIQKQKSNVKFMGIEVLPRANTSIPITAYDGKSIPFEDNHFDYVMIVTVFHHTDDYEPLMREAKRVAKKGLIILDHQYSTKLEWWTLAFIDFPGNVPFGVYTPFNFKTRKQWQQIFVKCELTEAVYNDQIFLFGKIMNFLLGKKMHFITMLNK